MREIGIKTEFLGRVGLVYNTKPLTLEDLYKIIETSELLDKYLALFKDVEKEDVINDLKEHVKKNFQFNTIGARLINTLINQYFIKGGELEEEEVKELSFQTSLTLKKT